MDNGPSDVSELIEFPSDHIFKAFGPRGEAFPGAVYLAVQQITPVALDAMKVRPSSKGTYQCVSITVRLQNYQQLKAVYAALKGVPGLKYLL